MYDSRTERLAETLVNKCLEAKAGDRVIITLTGPAGLPLVQACWRLLSRLGAEVALRPGYGSLNRIAVSEMPEECLDKLTEPDLLLYQWATSRITIDAPESKEEMPPLPAPVRSTRRTRANAPVFAAMRKISGPICAYPTPDLAKKAGKSLDQYADFLFQACEYDWTEMEARLNAGMARFEGGDVVRILAEETDVSFRIKDVPRFASVGKGNMPSGEIYFSPIAESTVGHVAFEWPCNYRGVQVEGVRLAFREGKVVEAAAEKGEEFLLSTLDTDAGSRYLGEFGVGLNPGIQIYTNNILFDEKIGGTIHLALGQAYGQGNQSIIHWDMIKDMRQQGEIYLDGRLIYRNGSLI